MEYDGGHKTEDEERVKMEWGIGLPTYDELVPLSQRLISPELALAFGIKQEPCIIDQTSQDTSASLGGSVTQPQPRPRPPSSSNNFEFKLLGNQLTKNCLVVGRGVCYASEDSEEERELRKRRKLRSINSWPSELHRRFVDVVTHLGVKEALPKTIIKLMNVKGRLTREDVSHHLLKYRIHLAKMNGLCRKMKGLSTNESTLYYLFPPVKVPHEESSRRDVINHQQMMEMTKLCLGQGDGHI